MREKRLLRWYEGGASWGHGGQPGAVVGVRWSEDEELWIAYPKVFETAAEVVREAFGIGIGIGIGVGGSGVEDLVRDHSDGHWRWGARLVQVWRGVTKEDWQHGLALLEGGGWEAQVVRGFRRFAR